MIVVIGVCINKKGQVLLTQRNQPGYSRVHKKWQLPGGELEFGETPEKALKREMKEELGVEVKIFELIPYIGTNTWKHPKSQHHCVFLSYLTKISKGTPNTKHFETYHLDWFYPRQIKNLRRLPQLYSIVNAALPLIKKYPKFNLHHC